MGYSASWLGVRSAHPDSSDPAELLEVHGFVKRSSLGDWTWGRAPDQTYPDVTDALVEAARAAREPAFGGSIFESDRATPLGADPAGAVAFDFPINPDLDGRGDPGPNATIWRSPHRLRAAAEDLASWSQGFAPRATTADDLLRETPVHDAGVEPHEAYLFAKPPWSDSAGGRRWAFAEDGVRLVFDRLGFPAFNDLDLLSGGRSS